MGTMSGGELVAEFLASRGIKQLFTLCGGHISPILVASKARGIRIIDTRHEATAVFAADAVARLTGETGFVAVTAGPGITNSITALQNALLAQSPLVLLGGAVPTLLKGRGALQDIDQIRIVHPNVKWAGAIKRRKDILPMLSKAYKIANEGTPGPVFLEFPVDILYPEDLVRGWYQQETGKGKTLRKRLTSWYIERHVNRMFAGTGGQIEPFREQSLPDVSKKVRQLVLLLERSQKPVLLIGSGAITRPKQVDKLAKSVEALGIPTFLSGMARGLLGRDHPLLYRHQRKAALNAADLVILCGVPCDFRLDYGKHLGKAFFVGINRDRNELHKNRSPDLAIYGDPHEVVLAWSTALAEGRSPLNEWLKELMENENKREQEIERQSQPASEGINPVRLLRQLEQALSPSSIIVADGGDFVGTAAYTLKPRQPLSWLDPGVFGTLGVGAGFALGARLVNPHSEVFIIYGDGSSAYSLVEMDTFMRHQLPVIAIIGNDASWNQIARDQIEILKDACGTELDPSHYERIAEAFGAEGIRITNLNDFTTALQSARKATTEGRSVVINAMLAPSDFRKGSLSI